MKTTRILSWILALAMVLSMFPSGIFAVDNVETAEQTGVSDGTITGWHAYVGSPTITHTRKAMQVTSSTFPGGIVFTDRGLKNYVLETELSFSGGTSAAYAGVMVRSGDGYNVFHNLSSGSNALVNHQVSGNKWPNTVSSTSTVTSHAHGVKYKLRYTMQDNVLKVESLKEGETDWVIEFENVNVTELSSAVDDSGFIGFYVRKATTLNVYSVTIDDLDSDYSYTSDFPAQFNPDVSWVQYGSSTISKTDEDLTIVSNNIPERYYTNVDWENYVLETEVSFDGRDSYCGIMVRSGDGYNVFHNLSVGSNNLVNHKISGNTWPNTVNSTSTVTGHERGVKYKLRYTMQDNVLKVESLKEGETEWVTEFENVNVTDVSSGVGDSGSVGFYVRKGVTFKVYNFTITDTDTGRIYDMFHQVGTWKWTNKDGTVTTEDGVMSITANAAPAAYAYVGANWTNYEMEAEISGTAQYVGITFRQNGNARGSFLANAKSGNHAINFVNKNTWGDYANAKEGFTPYTAGSRLRVKVILKNNLLTIKTKLVGVDTDWCTDFENFDISTLNDGALGDTGQVGFFTRNGSGMKVYAFRITDTDTGYTYNLFEPEEDPITESVVFDGNHGIDTSKVMSQTPETVELWFKTENTARQTLIHNSYTSDYGFYIETDSEGRIKYHENNGSATLDASSQTGYNDGKWHKLVVRRYYDTGSGLLQTELNVFTDNELVDSVLSKVSVIADSKKSLYDANSGVLPQCLFTKIGYYHGNRFLFTGEIAEIRMWNYTLSDEQIAQVHTNLTGKEEGLLHCFVPEDSTNLVDLVTSQTENEMVADGFDFWLEDYTLGDADFRIAVLGDVQQITEKFEVNIRNYFQWIRDHAQELNIKMVITLGDLVNTCTPQQFHAISEAASILDGVVPFVPLAGNHDYPTVKRASELFNEYFPYEKFSQYDYFGGTYEEGKMENAYYLMNVNGSKYMVMALEYAVRQEVVDWASGVIAAHPDHKVIVLEHNYLGHINQIMPNRETLQNTGISPVELYENMISRYDNIVLVLCGHMGFNNVAYRTDTTESGHVVNSLGFDFSSPERYLGTPNLMGLLGFTDGSNTVQVNMYSTVREQFFRSTDQFEIELDWQEGYRVTFVGADGETVFDNALPVGSAITAPDYARNYSDGVYNYTFTGWEGYSDGLTATQNYTFTAIYEKSDATVTVADALNDSIASAKASLYGGNAKSYVHVANNAGCVTSVATDKAFASTDNLKVFGESVPAFYVEDGKLYVHILAFGTADTVTLKGDLDVILHVNAFACAQPEVVTPVDVNHSRYDYLLSRWNATINGADQIALTSTKAVGEKAVVYFGGEYRLVSVTETLNRKVAAFDVAAENYNGPFALIENDTISAGTLVITCQSEITVDGDLSDWAQNILQTGKTMVGQGVTSYKNVTFYSYMSDKGLYVAAVANHDLFIDNATENWWDNTNLEFYLNGDSVRMWITANPDLAHEDVQGVIATQLNNGVYTSVAEGFIAMEDLPLNARSGELQIGFAWKTPGDFIQSWHTSGTDFWWPIRRYPTEEVEQYFANASGLWLYSGTRTANNIVLDGDFSDFDAEALNNKLSISSQDDSVGFDLYAQYVAGSGIYVGLKGQSTTNPRPNDTDSWYASTNLEFYIGENQYKINNRGAAWGYGLNGCNVYLDQIYDETTGLWHTTMEFFIPESSVGTANYTDDFVRMGFAFKPTGESVLLNGHTEATDFWHMYGHSPSDTENQFYVYEHGIFLTERQVTTPEKCTDMLVYTYTNLAGSTYTVEEVPENRHELHTWGEWTKVDDETYERICTVCTTEKEVKTLKTADLAALVAEAGNVDTSLYTDLSVQALNTALEAAKEVLAADPITTTQEEVDQALATLKNAIAGLAKLPNTVNLAGAVDDAENIDTSIYTDASVDAFEDALAAAKKILASDLNSLTQAEIDQALAALKNAIAGLVKASAGTNPGEGDIPDTGDTSFVVEAMAFLLISVMAMAAVVFVERKKYRR